LKDVERILRIDRGHRNETLLETFERSGEGGVLEEGVNFVQKPFSMQSLTAKLREVLDSK
jgi:hypothetical protein